MPKPRFSAGFLSLAVVFVGMTGTSAIPAPAPHVISTADVFAPPSPADLKTAVYSWIEQRNLLNSPLLDAIGPSWEFEEKPGPEALFDTLMRTFYFADEETRTLVDHCRDWTYSPALLQVELPSTDRDREEPLLTHNVRYFLARHLTLLNAYGEALDIFESINPKYVVDPAGCLFHRAVCEHHLLMKEQGLKTLAALQNQTQDVPTRYRKLAELMETDLEGVKEKTLGEVARQMKDVQRRLGLQQADQGTQEVEARIVATLDELIKKMEDQQNQSSGGGGGASGGAPSNPANESYLGGMKGPGLTDKKDIGHKDHWGDLPPKAREDAKNMLDQQFPAHYRQAVEQYLKKLAERPAPAP